MKWSPSILAAGALFACAGQARPELVNAIQAVVHDAVITYQEVNAKNEVTYDTLAARYRNQPEALQREFERMRTENLEVLVRWQLILHEFKTAGYNLPESILDELVDERIKAKYRDRATFTQTLHEEGMTTEKFRQQVRQRFIVDQLTLKNVSQEIIISPHKVENYYAAHKDDYKVEDEVKLRMIQLDRPSAEDEGKTRKLAEEIAAKLKEGASFEEMAKIYSQGQQKTKGGEWDWVDRKTLRKELSDVAFTLKVGERSDVIETDRACYLMRVEDSRPAHFKSLSEVRDQIEKNLLLEEKDRLEKQWIDKLKKKTFVRYFQ